MSTCEERTPIGQCAERAVWLFRKWDGLKFLEDSAAYWAVRLCEQHACDFVEECAYELASGFMSMDLLSDVEPRGGRGNEETATAR